jgi:protein-tyrosine phosphatase
VIFCSAGKDRTGLVTALVLSAIGVDDEAVIADYTRSHAVLGGAFREELNARAWAAGFAAQPLAIASGTPPELMRSILSTVRRRHGGAASYLLSSGVSATALDTLRGSLLDAAAGEPDGALSPGDYGAGSWETSRKA